MSNNYVPAVGPRDAKIVILGEAPGAVEVQRGEPFVGPSGKLLTQTMAQAGIRRDQCYITNVVKEKPPKNDIKEFIDLSKKVPKISTKGEFYLNALHRELDGLNANVIVPTGNTGLFALTGKKGITKYRGSLLEFNGKKVIPTLHPSSALRQYINRFYILRDFRRIAHHSTFPEIPEDHRHYILSPSWEESMEYLLKCQKAELVAFDIEVAKSGNEKEVSCISFAYKADEAISIPFYYAKGDYFNLPREAAIWIEVDKILQNPQIRKLAHNAAFDATFLFRKYGIRTVNTEDTMIAQGILHPDFRKALEYVTSWYTTMPYYKNEGKQSFDAQFNENFWRYNAKDSIVLMEAFPIMEKELKAQELWNTYRSQCELVRPLTYMTELGMRINLDSIRKSQERAQLEIDTLEYQIKHEVGEDFNPRSSPQVIDYFYNRAGYKSYTNRKTGRPTVDEKALKRLARKGSSVADLMLRHRELSKLKSTYLDVTLDPRDNRLRGSFNPIGTTTLRLSSSADIFGVGTNLQNLPPRMKENIVPDPGYLGFEVDLAQAENRVVAYLGPEPKMIAAFEDGTDIHSLTASYIFGKSPEEIKELYREYESLGKPADSKYCPSIGHGNKPFRYWGKEANHAFNYGLGPGSAALRWEIPEKDAKFIYESYHRIYPGVRQMHRWIKNSLSSTRTVTNLFGYKRKFLDRWENSLKAAYAFVAQSTVAEKINRHGIKYIYYRHDLFPEVRLLNQVHDSVVFQIPFEVGYERISRILLLIKASLESPLSFRGQDFIIPADFTIYPENFLDGVALDDLSPESIEDALTSSQVLFNN